MDDIRAGSTRLLDQLRRNMRDQGDWMVQCHSDVRTTEIYPHELGRGGMGVISPRDSR